MTLVGRGAFFLYFFLLVTSCSKEVDVRSFSGQTMGTTYTVKYIPSEHRQTDDILKSGVDALLKDTNNIFSTYINKSSVSRFNSLDKDKWFSIDNSFFMVLMEAKNITKISEGAFDITLGPAVNLWGFGPNKLKKVPSPKEIVELRKFVGIDKIIIDKDSKKIKKKHSKVYLDFSAIAKGYGVDAVSSFLEQNQVTDYMVEIGGELKTNGKKGKKDWVVAIEKPDFKNKGRAALKSFSLKNLSIATSGSYRNFFKEGNNAYSHTIDPQTLSPIKNKTVSVSVIHRKCTLADAWATALMAMPFEKAFSLAKKVGLNAFFIVHENSETKEHMTESFKDITRL